MKISLSKEKKDFMLKTFVWNWLLEFFKNEKNIEIWEFLISIKIFEKKIIISTNKPILNNEILNNLEFILKNLDEKFQKIDEKISDYKIKLK